MGTGIDDDRPLFGLAEITQFINEFLGKDFDEKTIAGWVYRGLLPTRKFGHRHISSTGSIRRLFSMDHNDTRMDDPQ